MYIVETHNPKMIVLCEIRVGRARTVEIVQSLSFDGVEMVEPMGFKGGLVILWNTSIIQWSNVIKRD